MTVCPGLGPFMLATAPIGLICAPIAPARRPRPSTDQGNRPKLWLHSEVVIAVADVEYHA
jgi:hypothetical protein